MPYDIGQLTLSDRYLGPRYQSPLCHPRHHLLGIRYCDQGSPELQLPCLIQGRLASLGLYLLTRQPTPARVSPLTVGFAHLHMHTQSPNTASVPQANHGAPTPHPRDVKRLNTTPPLLH